MPLESGPSTEIQEASSPEAEIAVKTPEQELADTEKTTTEAKKSFLTELTALNALGQNIHEEGAQLRKDMDVSRLSLSLDGQDKKEFLDRSFALIKASEETLDQSGRDSLMGSTLRLEKQGMAKGVYALALGHALREASRSEQYATQRFQADIEDKIEKIMDHNPDLSRSLLKGKNQTQNAFYLNENGEEISLDQIKSKGQFDVRAGLDVLDLNPSLYAQYEKQFNNDGYLKALAGADKDGLFAGIQGGWKF